MVTGLTVTRRRHLLATELSAATGESPAATHGRRLTAGGRRTISRLHGSLQMWPRRDIISAPRRSRRSPPLSAAMSTSLTALRAACWYPATATATAAAPPPPRLSVPREMADLYPTLRLAPSSRRSSAMQIGGDLSACARPTPDSAGLVGFRSAAARRRYGWTAWLGAAVARPGSARQRLRRGCATARCLCLADRLIGFACVGRG